jgi:shikimate 5-dehydrogenase
LLARCNGSAEEAVFGVNFDAELGTAAGPLVLDAWYQPFSGDLETMLQLTGGRRLNGRWMLVAQHLACWEHLWAPHLKDVLPSIDLLLTQLLHAEALLNQYA